MHRREFTLSGFEDRVRRIAKRVRYPSTLKGKRIKFFVNNQILTILKPHSMLLGDLLPPLFKKKPKTIWEWCYAFADCPEKELSVVARFVLLELTRLTRKLNLPKDFILEAIWAFWGGRRETKKIEVLPKWWDFSLHTYVKPAWVRLPYISYAHRLFLPNKPHEYKRFRLGAQPTPDTSALKTFGANTPLSTTEVLSAELLASNYPDNISNFWDNEIMVESEGRRGASVGFFRGFCWEFLSKGSKASKGRFFLKSGKQQMRRMQRVVISAFNRVIASQGGFASNRNRYSVIATPVEFALTVPIFQTIAVEGRRLGAATFGFKGGVYSETDSLWSFELTFLSFIVAPTYSISHVSKYLKLNYVLLHVLLDQIIKQGVGGISLSVPNWFNNLRGSQSDKFMAKMGELSSNCSKLIEDASQFSYVLLKSGWVVFKKRLRSLKRRFVKKLIKQTSMRVWTGGAR